MASKNDYTTINTVNNMRVVDDLSKATNPDEFVCVLNTDKPGGQMDLRLDSMVKMYIEPID